VPSLFPERGGSSEEQTTSCTAHCSAAPQGQEPTATTQHPAAGGSRSGAGWAGGPLLPWRCAVLCCAVLCCGRCLPSARRQLSYMTVLHTGAQQHHCVSCRQFYFQGTFSLPAFLLQLFSSGVSLPVSFLPCEPQALLMLMGGQVAPRPFHLVHVLPAP